MTNIDPLLVNTMLTEGFYLHPVESPIQLIQTHISYVFLTGNYAYKLKKAVDFGFLNFSTPEKRHHFTQEELRLNQPIAPDIYLEVLPISWINEQYQLNGEGEIKEYVLKMRQFPQENLLINLLKQEKITPVICQELGKSIANFHKNTQNNDYITSFGSTQKIGLAIEENYQHTQQYLGTIQDNQQYQETKAFTDRFLQEKEIIFQQRQAKQKIRECHGDLHLKNICIYNNQIQLFDRIEFNEPFRYADVMYDIAFTVMDFDFQQAQHLGNIVLNTYLEATGDWDGVQVLPLYLSRQAYVRAKVNSLTQDDPNLTPSEQEIARLEAIKYYQLAWQYGQPRQGRIMMMSGVSGSGKTTLARKLAQQFNAIHIRSDAVRKHLGGIGLETKGEASLYTPEMNSQTYQELSRLGIMLAQQGFSVILDAKYDRYHWRQEIETQAESAGIPMNIYYCTAPLDVLQQRLEKRRGDISDATPNLVMAQLSNQEEFTDQEKRYITYIDTIDKL